MHTIFTKDELDGLFGPMQLYGSDKQIIITEIGSNTKLDTKLEAYCEANNYEWDYSDSIVEDYDMNIAYRADVFGNYPDAIMTDCEWLGRAGFDDGTYDWDTISEEFINKPTRALPEWFPTEQLTTDGFELQSCDFADGWYDRADNPKEILSKANEEGYDLVFQINYYHQFECSFCVWKKETT